MAETLAVTTVAIAAVYVLTHLQTRTDVAAWLLVPLVWVGAALVPTALRKTPWPAIGLKAPHPRRIARRVLSALLLSATVLFLLTWKRGLVFPEALLPTAPALSWTWVVYQIFYVAVGEELFFRGYLQSNLTRVLPARGNVDAVIASSLVFALAHVIVWGSGTAWLVFFPGLLMGWLRARTDSLLAPILFHGLANVGYAVLRPYL